MLHELRLHDAPFRNIQKGIKQVEARLFDEKRQQIKPGDAILFINRDRPEEKIHATVLELFLYPSFNEMFKALHEKYRPQYKREDLEDSMLQYYSAEEEKKYGAVGIRIQIFSPQEETLAAYNENIAAFVDGTIKHQSPELIHWIAKVLAGVEHSAKIFEVGTGTGRDADYIESLGYKIVRSDAAQSFITYNIQKGKNIIYYDALQDLLPEQYDLLFANAVLLHFTHEQCEKILAKRKSDIAHGGKLARSVQEGTTTGRQLKENKNMKRYFYFRSEAEVKEMMKKLGYKNIDVWVDEPEPGKKWIRCIATL